MPLEVNQDINTVRLNPSGALGVPGSVEVDKGGGMRTERLPCPGEGGFFTIRFALVVVAAPSPVAIDRVPTVYRKGGR